MHFLLLIFVSTAHPAGMSTTAYFFVCLYHHKQYFYVEFRPFVKGQSFWPLSSLDNTKKTYFKGNLHLELTPSWHFDVFSLGAECEYWCNMRVLALLVLQLNAFSLTAAGWLVHLQLQGHIMSSRTYQMLATHRASCCFFVFFFYFVSHTNDLHV